MKPLTTLGETPAMSEASLSNGAAAGNVFLKAKFLLCAAARGLRRSSASQSPISSRASSLQL